MTDGTELVDDLRAIARDHVHLATICESAAVAEMHIDLAMFSEQRARVVRQVLETVVERQ